MIFYQRIFFVKEYGGELKIYEGDDEYVEATETDWYKKIKAQTSPGDAMRIYRKNHNLTQAQLGEKIGKVPRQIISNMERGNRTISLATAKKLAAILSSSGGICPRSGLSARLRHACFSRENIFWALSGKSDFLT